MVVDKSQFDSSLEYERALLAEQKPVVDTSGEFVMHPHDKDFYGVEEVERMRVAAKAGNSLVYHELVSSGIEVSK